MAPECKTCQKSSPQVTLKKCAKCSTTNYCSRDCQKADWKAHKKICSKQAEAAPWTKEEPVTVELSPPKGVERGVDRPFTRLDNGTWLHDRSERDVYRLLVDAYRLRVEDIYNLDGEIEAGSLYDGAPTGLPGFRRFLNHVERFPHLLPAWWNAQKRGQCEALGMNPSQWHDLQCAVEKSDIIEHYGDARFPMQLRMFAESVFGRTPGGTDGTVMRQMMMAMEQGAEGVVSTIDMSALTSRR
ncbi:hypothetical protein CDD80_5324 [Ophiocordyceps camponoti-rufipedis]|uniref:MYND-type domain-containing protein n=1 Tax=Ophiocordyceps camponoti-rufipedis TaxID=2004952 RepID=A0A2C5ZHG1_9HYPO|nr:hypothetical protein CDD80_5324 [Ophiocordyceps camponoti-rufipedis]